MRTRYRWLFAAMIAMLVAAACGDSAETTTTGAPGTTATTLATTTTAAEMNRTVKLGHVSTISIYDVVPVITHERLNAQGWDIEDVVFARTELTPLALAQNSINMAIELYLEPLRTVAAAPEEPKIQFVMENNGSEFVIISRSEYPDCQALDGRRFGIHGEESTVSIAAVVWLEETCGVNAEILVIPGGENRIVALENDELDATLVQLGDWLALQSVAEPGKYQIIDSGGAVSFSGAGYWVNKDFLAENHDTVVAYFGEMLRTFQMIHDDPTILEDAVRRHVDVPEETVAGAVAAYLEPAVRLAPVDGGSVDTLTGVIDYFVARDQLDPGLTLENFWDPGLLEEAREYLEMNP